MKYRLLFCIRRLFSPQKLIAEFHQFSLLTSVGGMVAFLFSNEDFPLWTLALVAAFFGAGVIASNMEK